MLTTLTLAAFLAQSPTAAAQARPVVLPNASCTLVSTQSEKVFLTGEKEFAVDLHPMTEEEKRLFPGRERFDKTEWYESQFKSIKTVIVPEHVDEWNNGGVDFATGGSIGDLAAEGHS